MKKLNRSLLALSWPFITCVVHANEPAPAADDAAQATAPNPSSTSNTTTTNQTRRDQEELTEVVVQGKTASLGGGLMSVQEAPKAVSTISREAIEKSAPGANYAQMLQSIPGMLVITDDVT